MPTPLQSDRQTSHHPVSTGTQHTWGDMCPPSPLSIDPRYANGHDITLGKQFIDPFYSISLLNTMHMISQRVETHKYKTYKFGIFELNACTDSLKSIRLPAASHEYSRQQAESLGSVSGINLLLG